MKSSPFLIFMLVFMFVLSIFWIVFKRIDGRFLRYQDEVRRTGETGVEETILEGHLGVTKELLAFQTPEKKFYIGCEKGGANLIKVSSI